MDHKAKRNIIIAVVGFFVLCVGLVAWGIYDSNKNPYDRYMNIANLDSYTSGRPKDRQTLYYIQYALFNAISDNTEREWGNGEIKDIMVREGTFNQSFVESSGIHSVSFIVDSESIEQSYRVRYQWADKKTQVLADDANAVVCVNDDEMIYGDFGCKDMFSGQTQFADPILAFLPYSTLSYVITGGGDVGGKYKLNVKIQLSAADVRLDADAAAEAYKAQARAWVKSIGMNLDDYIFNFEIISSSLY